MKKLQTRQLWFLYDGQVVKYITLTQCDSFTANSSNDHVGNCTGHNGHVSEVHLSKHCVLCT